MRRLLLLAALALPAAAPSFPSDIPANFKPADASFDFTRRITMIPMRDGTKLNTG